MKYLWVVCVFVVTVVCANDFNDCNALVGGKWTGNWIADFPAAMCNCRWQMVGNTTYNKDNQLVQLRLLGTNGRCTGMGSCPHRPLDWPLRGLCTTTVFNASSPNSEIRLHGFVLGNHLGLHNYNDYGMYIDIHAVKS
jgi:hypothetical protein